MEWVKLEEKQGGPGLPKAQATLPKGGSGPQRRGEDRLGPYVSIVSLPSWRSLSSCGRGSTGPKRTHWWLSAPSSRPSLLVLSGRPHTQSPHQPNRLPLPAHWSRQMPLSAWPRMRGRKPRLATWPANAELLSPEPYPKATTTRPHARKCDDSC